MGSFGPMTLMTKLFIPPTHQFDKRLGGIEPFFVSPSVIYGTVLDDVFTRFFKVGEAVERGKCIFECFAVACKKFAGVPQAVVERDGFFKVSNGGFGQFICEFFRLFFFKQNL